MTFVTTPPFLPGYRPPGAATRSLDSASEAAELLNELLEQPGEGDVVAVHEPFFNELPAALRRRIDSLTSPLVVVLPGGEGAHVEAERRAQHLRILWAAIGYQITFLEMVRQGTQVGASYGNYVPALIVIAALMISVNFTLSWFATWLEGRMRRSRKGPAPLHIQPVTTGTFGAGAGGTI